MSTSQSKSKGEATSTIDPRPGKRLHSSFDSHLTTELTLLRALIDRSKFQHRSQPFLQRMREVHRLGQRVQAVCRGEKVDDPMFKSLVPKLIHAILKASVSTQQIIELEHFLPTHIPVLAIYGRLFALCGHIAGYLSLDLEKILGGQSGIEQVAVSIHASTPLLLSDSVEVPARLSASSTAGESGLDIGQKIARPVLTSVIPDNPNPTTSERDPAPALVQTPLRSPSPSSPIRIEQDSPDPDFPEIPTPEIEAALSSQPSTAVRDHPAKTIKKKKRVPTEMSTSEITKKKKKRNDIDDIFGF